MELKYYVVFVSIVVLPKLLFCLRPRINTGIFKVVKKHPNVRKCAEKILQKEEYSSGRVHELTGDCEGLNSSVSNKKSYDKGYAYIEKVSFIKQFSPPVPLMSVFEIPDLMHGMMRGKVLSFETSFENIMVIFFAGNIVMDGTVPNYSSSSFVTTLNILYGDDDESKRQEFSGRNICVKNFVPGKNTRFSFKFETNVSMEVLIDNSVFCRVDIEQGNLGNIKQLLVSNKVHSISFV